MKKNRSELPGILLYLPQEGRGIGLMKQLRGYELQDGGHDTVEANETWDLRPMRATMTFSAQILKKLGAMKNPLALQQSRKSAPTRNSGIRVSNACRASAYF